MKASSGRTRRSSFSRSASARRLSAREMLVATWPSWGSNWRQAIRMMVAE